MRRHDLNPGRTFQTDAEVLGCRWWEGVYKAGKMRSRRMNDTELQGSGWSIRNMVLVNEQDVGCRCYERTDTAGGT